MDLKEDMMTWKRSLVVAMGLLALAVASVPCAKAETELEKLFAAPLAEGQAAYMFLAFSGVIVRTAAGTVVIDPANLLVGDDLSVLARHKVDAVLYTHGHGDHFDSETARDIVRATGAMIIADQAVAVTLRGSGSIPAGKILVAAHGQTLTAGAAKVRGVAGRHVGPITLFHIRLGPISIYHGGDSAYVPVADCPAQLAFLPVGRPSPTASPDYALKMALDVKPKTVVLMHGQDEEYAEFKKLAAKELPGVAVEVGEPFKAKVVRLD
jgi:L-ascorbate metabolism protein UlaG (beta-lactamase superfamily)